MHPLSDLISQRKHKHHLKVKINEFEPVIGREKTIIKDMSQKFDDHTTTQSQLPSIITKTQHMSSTQTQNFNLPHLPASLHRGSASGYVSNIKKRQQFVKSNHLQVGKDSPQSKKQFRNISRPKKLLETVNKQQQTTKLSQPPSSEQLLRDEEIEHTESVQSIKMQTIQANFPTEYSSLIINNQASNIQIEQKLAPQTKMLWEQQN